MPRDVLANALAPFLLFDEQCQFAASSKTICSHFRAHVWPNIRSLSVWPGGRTTIALTKRLCSLQTVRCNHQTFGDDCLEAVNPKTCRHLVIDHGLFLARHMFSLPDTWQSLETLHVRDNQVRIAREQPSDSVRTLRISRQVFGSQLLYFAARDILHNTVLMETLATSCPNLETLRSFTTRSSSSDRYLDLRVLTVLKKMAPRLKHAGLPYKAWQVHNPAATSWFSSLVTDHFQICEMFGTVRTVVEALQLHDGLAKLSKTVAKNLLLLAVDVHYASGAQQANRSLLSLLVTEFAARAGTVVFVNK